MKTYGPDNNCGPFEETGEISIPGKRWPKGSPTITVKALKNILAQIPEDMAVFLPGLQQVHWDLVIVDDKGNYRGFINLTLKEVNLWEPTI